MGLKLVLGCCVLIKTVHTLANAEIMPNQFCYAMVRLHTICNTELNCIVVTHWILERKLVTLSLLVIVAAFISAPGRPVTYLNV